MANDGIRGALATTAVFVTFIFSAVLLDAASITADSGGRWLLAAAVPSLVMTAIIRVYVRRRVRRAGTYAQSMRRAIASATTVGFAFGVMFAASIQVLDLDSRMSPVLIVLTFALSIGVAGTALVIFENGWVHESARRTRLLEEAVAVTAMRQEVVGINGRLRAALNADVNDALASARVSIDERLVEQERSLSDDQWESIARELRAAANDTVKPLSRQLWGKTAARSRPIQVRWVLRNIITKQRFQPLALSLFLVVTGFADAIMTYGWAEGSVNLAVGVAGIYVIFGGANNLMRRWPSQHAAIFISAVAISQIPALLNFQLRQSAGSRYTWFEFVAGVVIGVLAILMTSSIGSIRNHRDYVARTFQADIDREALQVMATSRHEAQLARELARILHGSVQTRLIACAVAIEQAAEIGDAEAFRSALHEAQEILRAPARGEERSQTTLAEEVERKVGLWQGLCAIGVDLDPNVANVSGRLARDVGRVVEEGLSNAIRHGGAKEIGVRVEEGQPGSAPGREGAVVVVLEDNGTGPGNGKPGLGSSFLDSVSESWQLQTTDSGARLSVVMT